MKAPENFNVQKADKYWITEGPNSGGIEGWMLWKDHLFSFQSDYTSPLIGEGLSRSEFTHRYREAKDPVLQSIIEYLENS